MMRKFLRGGATFIPESRVHYYKPISTESYDEIIWGKVLLKAPFTFRAKINIGLETFYC